MVTRSLTGQVITPYGIGVEVGRVVVTPVLPVPADTGGVLAPTSAVYPIAAGQIAGNIVAPARYQFEVFDGARCVWRFARSVAAGAGPITLQEIYLAEADPVDVIPPVVRVGDDVTRLGSGTQPAGRVPTATGTGAIVWANVSGGGGGGGDMLKAVYDTDDDGIVDQAETVAWSGITGSPIVTPYEGVIAMLRSASVIGSLTGVVIDSVLPNVTRLRKNGHGLVLKQGDIIVITSAGNPANRGVFLYTGTETTGIAPDIIEIYALLIAPDANISLTAYRRAWAQDGGGRNHVMTTIERHGDAALKLAYRALFDGVGNSHGLHVFFGSDNGDPRFGSGESAHYPIEVYRYFHRGGPLMRLDALGALRVGAGIDATGGRIRGGTLCAMRLDPGPAPVLSCTPQGATEYRYRIVRKRADGTVAGVSPEATITTGPADLAMGYVRLQVAYVEGTYAIDVYRTYSGGTPASTGLIKADLPASLDPSDYTYFDDTGYSGNGAAPPADDTTGAIEIAAGPITSSIRATPTADRNIYLPDASGTVQLTTDEIDPQRLSDAATGGLPLRSGGTTGSPGWAPAPTTVDPDAEVTLAAGAPSRHALVVQGAPSQTANLVEIQDSTGAVVSQITSAGEITTINNQNAPTSVRVLNNHTGTAARAQVLVGNTDTGNNYGVIAHLGSGTPSSGHMAPNRTAILGYGTGGVVIGTQSAASVIIGVNNNADLSIGSSGSVTLRVGLRISNSGSAITSHVSRSETLGFAQLGAGESETLTITVPGAVEGNTVDIGIPNALAAHNASSQFTAWVSAANTVSVRRTVISADASDPPAASVRVSIWKY